MHDLALPGVHHRYSERTHGEGVASRDCYCGEKSMLIKICKVSQHFEGMEGGLALWTVLLHISFVVRLKALNESLLFWRHLFEFISAYSRPAVP
jgi:hypothetical protein